MNTWRGTITLSSIALICLLGTVSAANAVNPDPILSINAHLVDTYFTPEGGTFNLGLLTVAEVAPLTIVTTGGQFTGDVDFSLIVPLNTDLSSGGIADGLFTNGSIVIKSVPTGIGDEVQLIYLTADLLSLRLEEVFDNRGVLAGTGTFVITGGMYAPAYPVAGQISQITFRVTPKELDDFSDEFTGMSDITLTPVPEPATLFLVGTGALGAIGYLRRRRI